VARSLLPARRGDRGLCSLDNRQLSVGTGLHPYTTAALTRPGTSGHSRCAGAQPEKHHVELPLGLLVAVTGVSGSAVVAAVRHSRPRRPPAVLWRRRPAGECEGHHRLGIFDKIVTIDQTAIGRTPRSNTATYTDTFAPCARHSPRPKQPCPGLDRPSFSFKHSRGRCERCQGAGF